MSTPKQTSILQALTAMLRSAPAPAPARKREEEPYQPRSQKYFTSAPGGAWESASSARTSLATSTTPVNPRLIRLISWNIDMLVPFGVERMTAALAHLQTLVTSTPPDIAVVIFLQEMTTSDLSLIASSPWVQTHFNITDKDGSSWLSQHYGTTTLIDARLRVDSVYRVPFPSKFGRDGLFVDISLSPSSSSQPSSPTATKILRLCNVHLESLVASPPVRPHQLSAAAVYLQAPGVACGLLAGDLNAIEPFDRTLHSDNNLNDAYLSLGGYEDSDEGYTWGYQVHAAMRARFGCSRMDKILYCGDARVRALERIGVGVKVEADVKERVGMDEGQDWVSDHYGIMGDFEIGEGWKLNLRDEAEATRPKLC